MPELNQRNKESDHVQSKRGGDLRKLTAPNWHRTTRKCKKCGQEFECYAELFRAYCQPCSVSIRKGEEKDELERLLRQSDEAFRRLVIAAMITPQWTDTRFSNSNKSINRKAFAVAEEYATTFNSGSGAIIFYSKGYGSGKTHLAACIANHVLHDLRRSVLFKKARDLMLEIRGTYSDQGGLSEAEVLHRVLGVSLLVLDDVGIDTPGQWLEQTYWTVFDRRLEMQLPMVITTNYPLEPLTGEVGLGERIGYGALSRLRSLCAGRVIHTAEKDLR